MTEHIQVQTTVESQVQAASIARQVLERRLGACVQVLGPVESAYWWQGEMERAEEWICVIKTRSKAYPELEAFLRSVHPYETPEIIATPIVAASARYAEWIDRETARPLSRPASE